MSLYQFLLKLHLDKQRRVGGVTEGAATAHLAHAEAAGNIDEAGGEASSKHGVTREPVLSQ